MSCNQLHRTRNEPRCEKTDLRGFRPGSTQTGLYNHRRLLEAWNFGFKKKRDCTIYVAKTKVLISSAVTTQLICVLVFVYAKYRFSHNEAQIKSGSKLPSFNIHVYRNCLPIIIPVFQFSATCPSGWVQYLTHCYVQDWTDRSWSDAQVRLE